MKQIRFSIPVKLAILLAFLFMIITLVSSQLRYNRLEEEKAAITAQIEEVQGNIDEIQNRLDTPFDKSYIISLAKEKLGYCLPDEIIFYNDLIN